MGYWVSQENDQNMPVEFKQIMRPTCEYCGGQMLNYYNDDETCTNRKCENSKCVSLIAPSIVRMCELLGIKGIGLETAKALASLRIVEVSHIELLPDVLSKAGLQPKSITVPLHILFQMLLIPGVSEAWVNICSNYDSVQDLLNRYKGEHRSKIIPYENVLLQAESLLQISKRVVYKHEPLVTGNVMITGNIPGFDNRNDFIAAINQLTDGIVQLNVVGKRKTDVLCLIMGTSGGSGKVQAADEAGIPKLDWKEFRDKWLPEQILKRGGAH